MDDVIKVFVKKVVNHSKIDGAYKIKGFNEDSVYFTANDTEYFIDLWFTDEKGIDFILYKLDGDNKEALMSERYFFDSKRFYKRRKKDKQAV